MKDFPAASMRLARLRAGVMPHKLSHFLSALLRTVFFISMSYILLYPLLFMISTSLQSYTDAIDPTVEWVPKSLFADYYSNAIEAMDYMGSLINTLTVEIVSALIQVLSCAVAAYGMARFAFPEKKVLYVLLILLIMVPTPMVLIPMTLNFQHLDFLGLLGGLNGLTGVDLRPNILDTSLTFYLPSLFAVGLRSGVLIFIYMQFYRGLPGELEEAAWIDGAGPFRTFFRIIIPSSGVVLLTNAIFSIIWHWNDYYMAIMFLPNKTTISAALANIFTVVEYLFGYNHASPQGVGIAMAGCVLMVAPMLIFYLIVQRGFIKSVDRVGIVG